MHLPFNLVHMRFEFHLCSDVVTLYICFVGTMIVVQKKKEKLAIHCDFSNVFVKYQPLQMKRRREFSCMLMSCKFNLNLNLIDFNLSYCIYVLLCDEAYNLTLYILYYIILYYIILY